MTDLVGQLDIPTYYGNFSKEKPGKSPVAYEEPHDPTEVPEPMEDPKNQQPPEIDPKINNIEEKEPPLTPEEKLDPSKNPVKADINEGGPSWMTISFVPVKKHLPYAIIC